MVMVFSIDKNHVGWLKPWVLHIVLLNSYVEKFTLIGFV